MALYDFDNKQFKAIPKTTFMGEGVRERDHLQSALRENVGIVAPDCLVISEESSEFSGSQRRIDLLAIDKDAKIVVIELKRDDVGGHMELQSLRYAAMVSTLTFSHAVDMYARYLSNIESDKNAEKDLLEFLEWDEPREDDFGQDVRIILVSSDFDKEITSTVLWLNDRDIDIRCVRFIPYKMGDCLLIDVQQIIPLPEAKDYTVEVQKKSERIREAKSDGKDYSKYKFLSHRMLPKNRLVLEVVREYVSRNPQVTYSELRECFPRELNKWYDVIQKIDVKNRRLYFMKNEEIIHLVDADVVVCNQWGFREKMNNFISYARELGFEIEVEQ